MVNYYKILSKSHGCHCYSIFNLLHHTYTIWLWERVILSGLLLIHSPSFLGVFETPFTMLIQTTLSRVKSFNFFRLLLISSLYNFVSHHLLWFLSMFSSVNCFNHELSLMFSALQFTTVNHISYTVNYFTKNYGNVHITHFVH